MGTKNSIEESIKKFLSFQQKQIDKDKAAGVESPMLNMDDLFALYDRADHQGLSNTDTINWKKGYDIVVQDIASAIAWLHRSGLKEIHFSCICKIGSHCWPDCL